MGMVHRPKQELAGRGLFAQEDVVPVDAVPFGSVAVTIQSPGVEDHKPRDVMDISELVKLSFGTAPGLPRVVFRDERRTGRGLCSSVEGKTILLLNIDQSELEGW